MKNRDINKESTEKLAQEVKKKLDEGEKQIQDQIMILHKQNDKIEIDSKTNQNQELEDLKKQTQTAKDENAKKQGDKDKAFSDESKTKNQEIQEFISKIKEARKELDSLLEQSVSDRIKMSEKLEDMNRKVESVKDPKFYPDTLRQAEKEHKGLLDRLEKLHQQRDGINEQIKQADEENDKLEKEAKKLSEHKDINQELKNQREEVADKLNDLADSQRDLYQDNINKMKELQDLDFKIVEQDKNNVLLLNIIDLLKERLNFNVKDLDERIRELEDDIISIDHGTKRMDSKVDNLAAKVDNPTYLDALSRIQEKIKSLNNKNNENTGTKDKLRESVLEHESKITNLDPSELSVDDIKNRQKDLAKIETEIQKSEGIKNNHMKEYEKLINELGDLKSDIQSDYERNIKIVQKRDEKWVEDTTSKLTQAKQILDELKDKIEDDNPFMKRFARKLDNARNKFNNLKDTNDESKKTMDELSNRNLADDDYLSFIISLAEDQEDSDAIIEDTMKDADALLKQLSNIQSELDE